MYYRNMIYRQMEQMRLRTRGVFACIRRVWFCTYSNGFARRMKSLRVCGDNSNAIQVIWIKSSYQNISVFFIAFTDDGAI